MDAFDAAIDAYRQQAMHEIRQAALSEFQNSRLSLSMQALRSNNPLEMMLCAQALDIIDKTEADFRKSMD